MQINVLTSLLKNICGIGLLSFLLIMQGCSGSQEQEATPMETLPMKVVPLENLQAFQTTTGNWSFAGGVESNRQTEHDLNPQEGSGVLTNIPTEENNEHIFTDWDHGDLELELDFLMPKGSNSGIYLMGRYELQLLDSWGVDEPQFSDVGGIYERWDESQPEGQRGFEGQAPSINAARAPGLWQHVKILFHAPEFDEDGNKISNAVFKEVWLNGVLVQENVEVTGPTRAAPFDDEVPEAPLMIQGDHGPIAVKNIEYKRYDKKKIGLTDLTYEYYPGVFDQIPGFDTLEVAESSSIDSLAGNVITRDEQYALRYTGTIEIPNTGEYLFKLRNAGMVRMLIDGEPIFDQSEIHRMHQLASETIDLQSGKHDFTLEYLKHPNNWYWGLSLFSEGPQLRLQQLNSASSVPGGGRELPDLFVEVEDRVKTLRSFAMHKGSKRTHVINVGAPNGINFNYDLGQAALLHAWEGPFVNANEMWINRGEPQTVHPAGPPITFEGNPSPAILNSNSASWPDSVSWNQLDVEGYSMRDNGNPVFNYTLDGVQINDQFQGYDDNRHLVRTVTFQASETRQDFWFQLASGQEITQNDAGEYVVDDRSYYLNVVETGNEPQIIQDDDGYDLRISPLSNGTEAEIQYEIIW